MHTSQQAPSPTAVRHPTNLDALQAEAQRLLAEVEGLRAQIKPLQEKLTTTFALFSAAQQRATKAQLAGMAITAEKLLAGEVPLEHLEFLLWQDDMGCKIRSQAVADLLRSAMGAKRSYGLCPSGFSSGTQQTGLSLALTKGDSERTAKALQALAALLPAVKPVLFRAEADEAPWKLALISEETLSANGAFMLAISPDHSRFLVTRTRYSCITVEHESKTLADVMGWIEKHLPYDHAGD